jgi:hypothetical protein
LGAGQRLAMKGYVAIISLVVLLFYFCRPPAIALVVALIVVLSVKRHSGRAFAHIFKKMDKGLSPATTNRYTALTVILGF